ncbi:MAG: hypothetical protein R3183_06920 [Oleiphilaceae bacterium]|nr:hypothetical protein [Oleiphilaceae bacterium]
MSENMPIDEIITVSEDVEKGFFYLENRQFKGPFENSQDAMQAALSQCQMTAPGECRAIYHGSVRMNHETRLREPLADMHQVESLETINDLAV